MTEYKFKFQCKNILLELCAAFSTSFMIHDSDVQGKSHSIHFCLQEWEATARGRLESSDWQRMFGLSFHK